MVSQYLTRADNDLSYFFWRAELYQLSADEVERGWQQLKQRIWDNCPEKPPEGQSCAMFDALIAQWQPTYLNMMRSAQKCAVGL